MNIGYDCPCWGKRPDEFSSLNMQPSDDDLLKLFGSMQVLGSPIGLRVRPRLWDAQDSEDLNALRALLPDLRFCLDRESKQALAEFEAIYEI